jgi:hypothetical protein
MPMGLTTGWQNDSETGWPMDSRSENEMVKAIRSDLNSDLLMDFQKVTRSQ